VNKVSEPPGITHSPSKTAERNPRFREADAPSTDLAHLVYLTDLPCLMATPRPTGLLSTGRPKDASDQLQYHIVCREPG
jgi:hypothetical protein